jgi:23S rRNA pseudouridine2605 synthase
MRKKPPKNYKKKPSNTSKNSSKRYKNKPSKRNVDSSSSKPKPKPKPTHRPEMQKTVIDESGMRLNKYLAHAGICSRRKAADHIKNGLVTVNGTVINEIGHRVHEGDQVTFEQKLIQPIQEKVYLLLNKPKNVITTLKDENQRRTVIDFIKDKTQARVYPVGRLDRNTTGLLLLTNDGDFAQKLSHPKYKISKVYKATLDKALSEKDLEQIRNTLQLEDGAAPVVAIEYGPKSHIVGIEIHIGRNRIVRRIFEHLGYQVVKLDRIRYGQLTKKNLPIGKCRYLSRQEIVILKHLS